MSVRLLHGDCREVLATLPDASVDAVVTDPPYELGFMGKTWDGSGVAYDVGLWAEVLRVLKPGGHLLAFGGTRTYHRMTVAIEDAGFEVRDSLHWLYGSGFPKSLDVSKAIDKAAGAERPREDPQRRAEPSAAIAASGFGADGWAPQVKEAATEDAARWQGWGTALKPAHEPIVVARKPLVGTVAANVLEHGTGALNIDGCRVAGEVPQVTQGISRAATNGEAIDGGGKDLRTEPQLSQPHAAGRWPANLVFTHAADCEQVGTADDTFGGGANATSGFVSGYESGDGFVGQSVTVPVWRCAEGCPVAELDGQSGVSTTSKPGTVRRSKPTSPTAMAGSHGVLNRDEPAYGDTGGASRFFTTTEWDPIADVAPFRYVAKPSKRERNADGEVSNGHPTVKPVALMRWLVRLVTPPGGVVLDPFLGSGTTAVAAILEHFDAIGIELTADYLPIINGRIAWAEEQAQAQPATLFSQEAS